MTEEEEVKMDSLPKPKNKKIKLSVDLDLGVLYRTMPNGSRAEFFGTRSSIKCARLCHNYAF